MTPLTYLIFKLHHSYYAIDTNIVHEIIALPKLENTDAIPSTLAGLLNLHGEIIQVFDLTILFNTPSRTYSLNDYVIILKGPHFTLGLITSAILDIAALSPKPLNNLEDKSLSTYITEIAQFNSQVIFILDPNPLVKTIFDFISSKPHDGQLLPQWNPEDQSEFESRAQLLMKPIVENAANEYEIPIIVFKSDKKYFGVAPEFINEFIPFEDFTPIPHASEYLLGVLNYRGKILTLIDIWPVMKMEKQIVTPQSQILIVDFNDLLIGILVDEVLNLLYLRSSDFQPLPYELETTPFNDYAEKAVFYEKNLLTVLDFSKVLEQL